MLNALLLCCSLIYFVPLYRRQGKEGKPPLRYYIYTFIAGGTLGLVLSIALQLFVGFAIISRVTDPVWQVPLRAFLTGALVEECVKFFIGSTAIKKIHCTRKIDYILIMGVAGFGFEITESLLYAYNAHSAIVAFLRAILSSHLMWQLWMGAFYYEYLQAKARGDLDFAKKSLRKMCLVPFLLHGMIDSVPITLPASLTGGISLEVLAKLSEAEIDALAQKYPYLETVLIAQVGSTIVGIIILVVFFYFTLRMCWREAKQSGGEGSTLIPRFSSDGASSS